MLETSDLILKHAVFEDWENIWNNLWSHPESAKYMLCTVTLPSKYPDMAIIISPKVKTMYSIALSER